jgi:hypothetical protein
LTNQLTGAPFADYAFPFGDPGVLPFAGAWTCAGFPCTSKVSGVGIYRNYSFFLRDNLSLDSFVYQIRYGDWFDNEIIPLAGYWSKTVLTEYGTLTPTLTVTSTPTLTLTPSQTLTPLPTCASNPNSINPPNNIPACQVPPTATPTPTPRLTFTPTYTLQAGCIVSFTISKSGFTDVYNLSKTPPPAHSILIPQGSQANVFVYYLNASLNIAQIDYQSNRYWINSGGGLGLVSGNCIGDVTPIAPTINPQNTPAVEISLQIYDNAGNPCTPSATAYNDRMPNGLQIAYADCQYSKYLFPHVSIIDRPEMMRMLYLMQRSNRTLLSNAYEFKLRMENFFCVKLGTVESGTTQLAYQHLANIFLALSHTSYAFLQTDPTLGNMHNADCVIFQKGNSRLTIQRDGEDGQGAITAGFIITLKNNKGGSGVVIPQDPRNIVHEIGHYFNGRFNGYPNPATGSPLDWLYNKGEPRNSNGNSISYEQSGDWLRGTGLGVFDTWQKNDCNPKFFVCSSVGYKANEEFGDMFLNWIYDTAGTTNGHSAPVFTGGIANAGNLRRAFMRTRMLPMPDTAGVNQVGYGWIDCLINSNLSFCPR